MVLAQHVLVKVIGEVIEGMDVICRLPRQPILTF